MAYMSKELFDRGVSGKDCKHFIHPWHRDCTTAAYFFVRDGTKGICVFFLMMYAAQQIITRRKLTRRNIKTLIKEYLRSILHGWAFSTTFITSICLQKKLLGRLDYYLTCYGTGFWMGISHILSPPSRFTIEATYFSIMAVECCGKHLSEICDKGGASRSRSKIFSTGYFMLSNAVLMSLLRYKHKYRPSLNITWLFKPYSDDNVSINEGREVCSHGTATCQEHFIKETTRYFFIGLGICGVKLIMAKVNGKSLTNSSLLKEPLFLSCYVALHKLVHCGLNLWKGDDRAEHAALAGAISGITYIIYPNLSIPSTSTVIIVMSLFEQMKKKFNLPKVVNYQYLCYIISTTVLMHFAIVNRRIVPEFFMAMIRRGTNGRSDEVFGRVEAAIFAEASKQ